MSLGLAPSDVHVPSAGGDKPKRKARLFSEVLAEVQKDGLYVGRLVQNVDELEAWTTSNGLPLDEHPHVTVLYSTTTIPWGPRQDSVTARVTGWKVLGPDKAVVLTLESSELDQRHQEAMDRGGTSTYSGFLPHVTLFYLGADGDPDGVFSLDHLETPTFPIILGPELVGDPDEGDVYVTKDVAHLPAGTPGGKGGEFAPGGSHGGGLGGGAGKGKGTPAKPPQAVPGAITKYDTVEVVKMRAEAKRGKDTSYLPGRTALQKQIVATVYGDGAAQKNRVAHIVIGGPGSGKSSVGDELAKKHGALVVDSDIIKEHIPEFNGGKNAGGVHQESLALNLHLMAKATRAGDNIVLPTTGRDEHFTKGIIRDLSLKGYEVHLHHVDLPVDKAVARTISRAVETGRFVDPHYTANIVGTSPRRTFNALKTYPRIATATAYDNDVPRGAAAIVTESRSNGTHAGNGSGSAPAHGSAGIGRAGAGRGNGSVRRVGKAVLEFLAKAQQHFPAGTPGGRGGQFMPIGGHGGGGSFQAPLSGGSSSMPQHYNRSVQDLARAFQNHHGNPAMLLNAINNIKGPPLAHSFGQKFAGVKAQAVGLAQAMQTRPAPPPTPPVLPTSLQPVATATGVVHGPTLPGAGLPPRLPGNLPANKQTWNQNTINRITAASNGPNPLQALQAISISQSHNPLVRAYHRQAMNYHGQVAMGAHAGGPPPASFTPPAPPRAAVSGVVHAASAHVAQPITLHSLPAAPVLNPALGTPHTHALFHQKVSMLQQAAMGPNPTAALHSIQALSPDMSRFKNALIQHVAAHSGGTPQAQALAVNVAGVKKARKTKAGSTPAAHGIDSYQKATSQGNPDLSQMNSVAIHHVLNGDMRAMHALAPHSQAGDTMLSMMYKHQGFDRKPKVVDDATFDSLVRGGGLEMVRTVRDVPGRKSTTLADDFMHGEYYAGLGIHGNGTYAAFSTTRSAKRSGNSGSPVFGTRIGAVAWQDSAHYAMSNPATMFRMVLRPDAKISTKAALNRSMHAHLGKLGLDEQVARQAGDFKRRDQIRNEINYHQDIGRHAAALGVDAYTVGRGGRNGSGYMVLLNRSAVAVRQRTEDPNGSPRP